MGGQPASRALRVAIGCLPTSHSSIWGACPAGLDLRTSHPGGFLRWTASRHGAMPTPTPFGWPGAARRARRGESGPVRPARCARSDGARGPSARPDVVVVSGLYEMLLDVEAIRRPCKGSPDCCLAATCWCSRGSRTISSWRDGQSPHASRQLPVAHAVRSTETLES
jgi:hypothetical protein